MLTWLLQHVSQTSTWEKMPDSRGLRTFKGRRELRTIHDSGIRGPKIAHRKSTPQKSLWIFSGMFQWIQWSFPTEFHLSVVFSKGLTTSQWMFTGHFMSNGHSLELSNGVPLLSFLVCNILARETLALKSWTLSP